MRFELSTRGSTSVGLLQSVWSFRCNFKDNLGFKSIEFKKMITRLHILSHISTLQFQFMWWVQISPTTPWFEALGSKRQSRNGKR